MHDVIETSTMKSIASVENIIHCVVIIMGAYTVVRPVIICMAAHIVLMSYDQSTILHHCHIKALLFVYYFIMCILVAWCNECNKVYIWTVF